MVNNKKLQLQKRFLEKQLEKDVREIHIEMNKIQIEIQQDQIMNSASALQRFKSVYQSVSDQLNYAQQIVGFMDFDQDVVGHGKKGGDESAGHQTFDDVAKEMTSKLARKAETMGLSGQ